MNSIADERHQIYVNHNSDFSGYAFVSWKSRSGPAMEASTAELKLPGLKEYTRKVDGLSLIAGFWVPLDNEPDPPLNVITRAVAMAVEAYLLRKAIAAIESISIPTGPK